MNERVIVFFEAMERRKVTPPLTYYASGAQACQKPSILLEDAPTKQVLPQDWLRLRYPISSKEQKGAGRKTDWRPRRSGRATATRRRQARQRFCRTTAILSTQRTSLMQEEQRRAQKGNNHRGRSI